MWTGVENDYGSLCLVWFLLPSVSGISALVTKHAYVKSSGVLFDTHMI